MRMRFFEAPSRTRLPRQADVRDYRVYVEPLIERLGGGFVAYAPELRGCIADGETPQEALAAIYDAIECWLEEDAVDLTSQIPVKQSA
ncbi:type II toxin-antitoxin system HicB family antitoxin [Tsuneonella amylolytica]|uniref:type II toxin-antitoxin system HicB family antitoxin n=1 Tax=Tsuneonella amylolytica TaxID=2338327 RepID=UPI001F3EF737|nr:type II toxin-antitoxin system HicB family antitoxin [Tsuneonella amylolytica]